MPADERERREFFDLADGHLLSLAENAQALSPLFKDPEKIFNQSLEAIFEVLDNCDNRSLLCILSETYLTTFGHVKQPEFEQTQALSQGHIEFLQFLIAKRGNNIPVGLPPTEEAIDILISSLYAISMAFFLRRIKEKGCPDPKDNVIESVRMHRQSVRNVGYPQQIRRIATEVLKPIDSQFEQHVGVKGTTLVQFLFSVESLIESRIREHVEKICPVLQAENLEEIYSELDLLFPETKAKVSLAGYTLDEIRSFIYQHSLWFNYPQFTMSLADMKPLVSASVSDERLVALLDSLSANLNGLTDAIAVDEAFLNNPVLEKPFLKLGENEWLCPIPGLLAGQTLNICEKLIEDSKKLKEAEEKQRGKFLEKETSRLLKDAFPTAIVHPNVKYRIKDAAKGETDQGETDVLVLAPPFLLVFNCKSNCFSEEAREGAKSIAEEIGKIVSHPAKQSKALLDELRRQGTLELVSGKNRFSISSLDYPMVIPISVVLEPMCSLLSNLPSLQANGLIDSKTPKAPVMTVTDLEGVLEILPTEMQRMHYFLKRYDVESSKPIMSNEFGLLLLYLQTSLASPLDFYQELPLLPMYGSYFDPYFMEEWTKEKVQKPEQLLPAVIKHLIESLESDKPEGWRAIGVSLLDQQREWSLRVDGRIGDVIQAIQQNEEGKVRNQLEFTTDLEVPQCLVFWIHPKVIDLDETLEAIAEDAFKRVPVESMAVIWIEIGNLARQVSQCKLFRRSNFLLATE